jgi:hypothetical protein
LTIKIYIGTAFHKLCFDVLILVDGASLTCIIFDEKKEVVKAVMFAMVPAAVQGVLHGGDDLLHDV